MKIADLVGVPYRLGGRGPSEYDCAGLLIECQSRQGYVVSIPDNTFGVSDQLAMFRILQSRWTELPGPEPGCAVFFPSQAHVGTMIDHRRFLHTTSEQGEAFLDSLDNPLWAPATKRFYRFRSAL